MNCGCLPMVCSVGESGQALFFGRMLDEAILGQNPISKMMNAIYLTILFGSHHCVKCPGRDLAHLKASKSTRETIATTQRSLGSCVDACCSEPVTCAAGSVVFYPFLFFCLTLTTWLGYMIGVARANFDSVTKQNQRNPTPKYLFSRHQKPHRCLKTLRTLA